MSRSDETRRAMKIIESAVLGLCLGAGLCLQPANADPNRIGGESQSVVLEIGQRFVGDTFPVSSAPGYMIARGSMGTLVGINSILKDLSSIKDPERDLLTPLRMAEAVWPDRESANGQKISRDLWSCRDAVVLMRISTEYALAGDVPGMEMLQAPQKKKSVDCVGAMSAIAGKNTQ